MKLTQVRSRLPTAELESLLAEDPLNMEDLYLHTGKYLLKMDLYLQEKIDIAVALGLDSSKGKKILDIGSGIGLFPWLCKDLGHVCHSTYYDKFPFYEGAWKILKIEEPFHLEVKPDSPWDIEHSKFDIITAHRTVFDRYPSLWTAIDWLRFIRQADKCLNRDGVLFVKTNCSEASEYPMDEDAKRLLSPFMLEGFNSDTFSITKEQIRGLLGKSR